MDRIEQRLRDVFLHSLGPGGTLPDAESIIFSILAILAILSTQLRFVSANGLGAQ